MTGKNFALVQNVIKVSLRTLVDLPKWIFIDAKKNVAFYYVKQLRYYINRFFALIPLMGCLLKKYK